LSAEKERSMKCLLWNKPYIDNGDGYEDIKKLKAIIGKGKYRLDCGHKVTLGHNLGNDIAIINGKELKIICTLCLY
jgi:hypothetical protein